MRAILWFCIFFDKNTFFCPYYPKIKTLFLTKTLLLLTCQMDQKKIIFAKSLFGKSGPDMKDVPPPPNFLFVVKTTRRENHSLDQNEFFGVDFLSLSCLVPLCFFIPRPI